MTVNIDPHNTGAIFGTPIPATPNGSAVPQAQPRLAFPGKSPAKLPHNLRKALGDAFIADAFADWQIWGPVAIERMRTDDPTGYVKMMAQILPKEVAFEHRAPLAELTDEQLEAVYASFEIIEPDSPKLAITGENHDGAAAIGLEGPCRAGEENPSSAQEPD